MSEPRSPSRDMQKKLLLQGMTKNENEVRGRRVERGAVPAAPFGSTIVAMAAAIVTIANVVMAAVVEPQQSWS